MPSVAAGPDPDNVQAGDQPDNSRCPIEQKFPRDPGLPPALELRPGWSWLRRAGPGTEGTAHDEPSELAVLAVGGLHEVGHGDGTP